MTVGSLSWIDILLVAVVTGSVGFGIWRGFAKEALSVVTWLAAIWLAWRFAFLVEPLLGQWSSAPELRVWAARAVIFVVVLVAGVIVAWLVRELIRHTGLSGTDRALGSLFGLLRGVIMVGVIVIGLQLAGLDNDPWWQQARLRVYGEGIADGLRYYAELGGDFLQQQEIL